jgi:hypothetical protein
MVAAGGLDDTSPEEAVGMGLKAPQVGQNLGFSKKSIEPAASKQFYDADDERNLRHIDANALFARFSTLSTLTTAVAEEHGQVNRLLRTGSNSKLDELEEPTLDASGLRHVLRGVGLGVPNSASVRPMLDAYGQVVGCQPRLTFAQFEKLRADILLPSDLAAAATVQCAWRKWRARRLWHRAVVEAKTRAARKATIVWQRRAASDRRADVQGIFATIRNTPWGIFAWCRTSMTWWLASVQKPLFESCTLCSPQSCAEHFVETDVAHPPPGRRRPPARPPARAPRATLHDGGTWTSTGVTLGSEIESGRYLFESGRE